jgi:hypothetical protein
VKDSSKGETLLRGGITVSALVLIVAHLCWPDISIDPITVTLFVIGIVPWLSSIFKSLEFPGGGKLEFQELKEKVGPIIDKASEPVPQAANQGMSATGYALDGRRDGLVIKALADPRYTWRYLGGLKESTELSESDVMASLDWFRKNDLVVETTGRAGRLWALSPKGLELFAALSKAKPPSVPH